MNGWSDWPEEKGEDVTRLVGGDNDGRAEVLHLQDKQQEPHLGLCAQITVTSVKSFG